MASTIVLRRGKEESLLRFHPWVFSGAIHHIEVDDQEPQEGELVEVRSADGQLLGRGHFQIGSIAVRILSFLDEPIDDAFWHNRIEQAYQLRQSLGLIREDNNTYRLIHGEGDFLPGLVVDVYGDTAVMQAHSVGMHLNKETIAQALVEVVPEVQTVYYKSEGTLPYKAKLEDKQDRYLIPSKSSILNNTLAIENGLKFHIDWLHGQKTGFFVDQRYNRSLLEQYAKGRKVLNMFCYTGGFSVYALRGGAELVHSVDSSGKAIELVNQNVELNFPDCKYHEAFATDAFEFLNDIQDKYDLIILDPPAFAKHREAIRNALRGYTRLNALAFRQIKSGGILFTFSCSQAVDKQMFRNAVFTAAAQSGRRVRILHQLTQPADHPINIYHPEGEYLKGLVLQVE